MLTITLGTQSVYPELVTGYESRRESGNILHTILGRVEVDVSFKAAGLRTGSLEVYCADLTTALATDALHAQVGVLHLTDDAQPGLDMYYVLSGPIEVRPQIGTPRWLVRVEYTEVLP